jgi:hypothetical protein
MANNGFWFAIAFPILINPAVKKSPPAIRLVFYLDISPLFLKDIKTFPKKSKSVAY